MFKTPGAQAFFAAWEALRNNKSIPHYRTVFRELAPDIIPNLLILEQMIDTYTVRFMGTYLVEFWGEDLTGRDRLFTAPKLANAESGLGAVLDIPCGLLLHSSGGAVPRNDSEVESIILPLTNEPDKPKRVLIYGQVIEASAFSSPPQHMKLVEHRWLDIGFGIPKKLKVM